MVERELQDIGEDKSLLIVDDDEPFLRRLARAMEKRGFEPEMAQSVAAGKAVATARPPAYAVVDLRLEDGNGLDVVELIREKRPDARIVVLTGYGASERARLDDLCRIMGLPGKTVTEGSKVYIHMMRGEVELVREYCELDALNTLMLYLLWAVHRGRLTQRDLHKNVDTIIAGLRVNESRKAWQQYADALADWPAWAK